MHASYRIASGIASLVGLVLVLLSKFEFAVLAFLFGTACILVGAIRKGATTRSSDSVDGMDGDSRALFVPIKRLVGEIEEIVTRHQDGALMRTIGEEARTEAIRIREQIAKALAIRSDLKRARRGASLANQEIGRLQTAIATADEGEKPGLESTLAARQIELEHYASVNESIEAIDRAVKQAEAGLSEIRARLAVGVTGELTASSSADDNLRESLSRMKALSISVDEAEQVLRGS